MRTTRRGPGLSTMVDEDLVVHRIVEQVSPFLHVEEMLPGLAPGQVDGHRTWGDRTSVTDDDHFEITYQSYVVQTPHHTIAVDSCLGNGKVRPRPEWHDRAGDAFLSALDRIPMRPEDVDVVVCTHLHGDHIGWHTRWADGRWQPTFPNARYVFSRAEVDKARLLAADAGFPPWSDSVVPILESGRVDLVDAEHEIGDHCRMLPTPGHTAGHMAWRFGRTTDRFVMMGDLLHVPVQVRHPELAFSRDLDADLAATTRRAFLERYSDTETVCCTGHFPDPAVGRVRPEEDGFRLVPCHES